MKMNCFVPVFINIVFIFCVSVFCSESGKRHRGESFYTCNNSNTTGPGNIWFTLTGIGHIWDDKKTDFDTTSQNTKWSSNLRAFPQLRIDAGLLDYFSIFIQSRVLSWGFKPGWITSGLKLTYPDNSNLRLHGFGFTFNYTYHFIENNPSIGGYNGFMPEGFVVKGSSIESIFTYELDLLAVLSKLPLRFIINTGLRLPLHHNRTEMYQFLCDAGIIFNGYFFDLFVLYSLESLNNFFKPAIISQENKRFCVYFSENPMYLTFGGTVRYKNGMSLSLSVPLLLSNNKQSSLKISDKIELHRNEFPNLFKDEKSKDIKDPFDPWFVDWKIALILSIPVRFKRTGSEMIRDFLILKTFKRDKTIDIDERINTDNLNPSNEIKSEKEKRLEKIKKRRKDVQNQD